MRVERAFSRALERTWLRDRIEVDQPRQLADSVTASFARGHSGVKDASDLLVQSGVRHKWNQVLRCDRAALIASRIGPLVVEPLLDVLSGDGSICAALRERGVAQLIAIERCANYPHSVLPACVSFHAYADGLDLSKMNASTALLSTVLHHEQNPSRVLDRLADAGIPRWIVIENCVTPFFSREFHQFADRFFNTCLNHFNVDCVDQHRTLDEWAELLGRYGSVTVIDESFDVPGIPFPYSLLLISRSVSRCRSLT